ncbi:unnamed protein product [Triticum turgidum subsp. durum]|uniref:Uncharacterized protein n=1 Tax=Triticum turgidum subsp. durum TaxID=4567 RepID=A0A9R0V2B7_TRITD|nr:unnamed protein product [Triticum turgidum subsp. durum]
MSGLRLRPRRSSSSTFPMPRSRLRHYASAMPMSSLRPLHRSSSSTTSPACAWSPHAAFAAATERVRAGALRPEDAHTLFDELLRQATPVPERSLNGFLAALARAPASGNCIRDGPALAVVLFNRVCREEAGPQVAALTGCTYSILMDCYCRARRPDLGLALFGRFLREGLKTHQIVANTFLKCLCYAKLTDEAVDVLLHRMSELGCVPDAISYNTVLKSLCDNGMSQRGLELLQMIAKEVGVCSLNLVAYNTVIYGFFKEGETGKACNLFHEMMQQGVEPDVVTYNLIIDALCKARAMDKAEVVLQQMISKGAQPHTVTYNCMINGYATSGRLKKSAKMFREMKSRGLMPDIVTCNSFLSSLCKHGRSKEAREIFDSMTAKGHKPDIVSYRILLHGYASEGCFADMIDLFNSMKSNGIAADCRVFTILIGAYAKHGMMDDAMLIFTEMQQQGLSPNVVTYSTVISALSRMGRLANAMEKFNQMISMGVQPNKAVYHTLIQGSCMHGDLIKAKELVSEMMNKADKYTSSCWTLLHSMLLSVALVGARHIQVKVWPRIHRCELSLQGGGH